MSYNIDSWRVKELDLRLPKGFSFQEWLEYIEGREGVSEYAIRDFKSSGLEVERVFDEWAIDDDCYFSVKGHIGEDGRLEVDDFDCYSEGSGHSYSVLLELFRDFGGSLKAIVVWEGGDSLVRLTIINGEVDEAELEY